MEIVRGNLIMFTAVVGMYVILFVAGNFLDGPFERAFSFYRAKNRKKELTLAVRMIAGVSAGCIVLYYVLCAILKGKFAGLHDMVVVIMTVLFAYQMTAGLAIKNDAGVVLFGIGVVFFLPNLLAIVVILRQVTLDRYCAQAAGVLFVINCLLEYHIRQYWKKGDI